MFRRVSLTVALIGALTISTSAQLVVIDPANLAQAVLIAQRTQQTYEQLQNEYLLILRMAQSLGNLNGYRIPPIAITRHDAVAMGVWPPLDRRAECWRSAGNGLPRDRRSVTASWHRRLAQLGTEARRLFERQYATVEISDSVAMVGGHQVALIRGYHDRLQQAVEKLQEDVLNTSPNFHQMTAVLDKVAAGELLARRQDMAANQLLSHALEQLLARNKRQRDTEAATLNMQLTTWRDGQAVNSAFASGTGDALRAWRQP